MVKQNYPKGRNRYDRCERRNLVKINNGRFPRSTAEKVAAFWPLAILPALLVTCGLWYSFVMQERLPRRIAVLAGIATAFLLNSLFTIWFYKTDKRQAEQQLRRIPEFHLHFWELFCGWPGALYAQRKCRHKWKKLSYMIVFWLYVVLNLSAAVCLVFPETVKAAWNAGSQWLRGITG